jgi:hypothetical protein
MKQQTKQCLFTLVLVMAALTLAGAGCKKTSNPFPASNAVNGWTKNGETRTFKAADLWQYIDGDAERYVSAGVVTTSTADYQYNGKIEATADVYTMSDEAGARKVFDSDPAQDSKSASIGDASRVFGQSLIFRKGPYLVRIVAFSPAPGLDQNLIALGHAIEGKL